GRRPAKADPPARSSTKDTNAVKGPSAPPTRRRTPFTAPPGRVPGSPSVGGADVLVDVEHVLRVVLPLDPREPVVVAAVGRSHPPSRHRGRRTPWHRRGRGPSHRRSGRGASSNGRWAAARRTRGARRSRGPRSR